MNDFTNNNREFPLKIKIGFEKLLKTYKTEQMESGNQNTWLTEILGLAEEYPELSSGIGSFEELEKYGPQLDVLLQPIFPPVLGNNEIKFATIPFHVDAFKSTSRYKSIIKAAGSEFYPDLINLDADQFYILGCSLILDHYYDKKLDFQRIFYYNIPDGNGITRNYRVEYNLDFIEIEKTPKAPEIKEEDFCQLLDSYEDISIWKEKFPPQSYIFNGFIIANMVDVTSDVSISDFKSNLLRLELENGFENTEFTRIFRSIFGVKDLMIGFTDYNYEDESFESVLFKEVSSFLLNGEKTKISKDALCKASYYTLFKQKGLYVITDAERYHKLYPDNLLYKKLIDQGLNSAIFSCIEADGRILGVLELVSPNANDLNTINANKLKTIMPYIIESVGRSKANLENELELIIQEECTSIHNSVHWKFQREAKRYLASIAEGNPTVFREIVFEDVYPLYGQIDIKSSSEVRNEATKKDLEDQLEYVIELVRKLNALEPLPIFEQMEFTVEEYLEEIHDNLQVDTERRIIKFLSSEVVPYFNHLSLTGEKYKSLVAEYQKMIDGNTGLVYKHRKDYDETVMQVNKRLAAVLDRKQQDAQRMFPHYFERFKTDGVEHNMYIGASITKEKVFNVIYLKNLKLWQLQVMWEMENAFYKFKEQLPVSLEVASMVLAFNGSLSLRFRMDEKRFDVDGTYNARYEVVKKRVDKAKIKGSDERVTQPGKITIVYSQKEDEEEYLTYLRFLQSQKLLDNDEEVVELEDLQGVTGLRAIRASVLYSKNNNKNKDYYTYDDLMTEIGN